MPALLVALFAALRDRDTIYGWDFRRTAEAMGIEDVLTAPWSSAAHILSGTHARSL
jgi:hypothetical protein